MVQGVNLIDFKIPVAESTTPALKKPEEYGKLAVWKVPEKRKPKEEYSRWKKWEIPKKDLEKLEKLAKPPKKPEGGKMLSLTQRLGFLILLIFILIVFFQLVGYYINSKR